MQEKDEIINELYALYRIHNEIYELESIDTDSILPQRPEMEFVSLPEKNEINAVVLEHAKNNFQIKNNYEKYCKRDKKLLITGFLLMGGSFLLFIILGLIGKILNLSEELAHIGLIILIVILSTCFTSAFVSWFVALYFAHKNNIYKSENGFIKYILDNEKKYYNNEYNACSTQLIKDGNLRLAEAKNKYDDELKQYNLNFQKANEIIGKIVSKEKFAKEKLNDLIKEIKIVPEYYARDRKAVSAMLFFMINKRADNITSLVNIYETQKAHDEIMQALSLFYSNQTQFYDNIIRLGYAIGGELHNAIYSSYLRLADTMHEDLISIKNNIPKYVIFSNGSSGHLI